MKNYLIAERYAKALSNSIPDAAQLDAAMTALQRVRDLYVAEHDLRITLANPAIDVKKRAAVLADVLRAEAIAPVVARLAEVLLRRGRIAILPDVATVFATQVDKRLNRVTAAVRTAVPLTDDQRARLQAALARFSGKTVHLACDVDRTILGGVVARMGGQVLDGSLRTRLERMKTALLAKETS